MILNLNRLKSIGQTYYGIFSVLLITIQSLLVIPLVLAVGWFSPKGIVPIFLLGIIAISFCLQIYLSAKRLVDAEINAYYSLLHLIPFLSPIIVFFLIVYPSRNKNDSSLVTDINLTATSDNFLPKKYYLWFFALYFILKSFALSFRMRAYDLQVANVRWVPIINVVPTLFAILSILGAIIGIYFVIRKIKGNNSAIQKILVLFVCIFILYSQVIFLQNQIFSESVKLYKILLSEFSTPKTVIDTTNQLSFILNNGREITPTFSYNIPASSEKIQEYKKYIGQEVIVRLYSYDEWKPNYHCFNDRCTFPAIVTFKNTNLNISK
jgi:hypothetical protein